MENLLLEELTYSDVAAGLNAGYTTAVVACGAVEQHGPHLPLFMDAEHGSELAHRVARRLGNALVAPAIRVGCSAHHMAFPGTLSLRKETFQALCLDYATSLSHHGFTCIYFIPSHGGNFGPLRELMPRLREAVGEGTEVVAFLDLEAQLDVWRRVAEAEHGLGSHVGGHADVAEASIMLALHPRLVRESEAAPGYQGDLTPEVLQRMGAEGIHSIAPNGILGDPRGMSRELGEQCITATVDLLVAHFHAQTGSLRRPAHGAE
jgi:creatinine amidohydrolase